MNAVDSILGVAAPQTDAQRRTYAARVARARKLLLRKSPDKPRKHAQRASVSAEVKALGQVTQVLIALPLASRERVISLVRAYVLGQA